ncbi:N-acetylglutamate synthase, CG3035 family [Corynebacterium anserum]|uniref:GNAT family N-acetyltransferase n=1 Tax=Corynebacterium anserum TaxID=2684406 RepID=A0A7G7YLZ4_9CORY|nr:GNAT family N-acetyltransferase [Corynebacterium anserum]QNH95514.1 GNAT family N-acetyltransferase [Corynebacterium anserum]
MTHQKTDFTAAAAGARRVEGFNFPLSRHTDPVSVVLGTRVIVRYALTEPGCFGPRVTDVIGILESISPLRVRPQARHTAATPHNGNPATSTSITIPADRVVVLKTLSAKPVRNSDIRAVEEAIAHAFPGLEHRAIRGWLARAGDGITERSNSAVPLGPNASIQPVPLEEIRAFYTEHNLPTQLLIPDRIGRAAESLDGIRGPEIIVMTRELPASAQKLPQPTEPQIDGRLEFHVDEEPDDEWLSMYHFRGKPLPRHALELLCTRIDGHLGFARLMVNGELAAITRGTVTDGGRRRWLGYSAVEVASEYRRQGLGTYLGARMLEWGVRQGADHAYLEVIESNAAGRALYHRLGFSEHHRHRSLKVTGPAEG